MHLSSRWMSMCVCLFVCVSVCVCVSFCSSIHLSVCAFTYIHTYIHMYIHTHTHACMPKHPYNIYAACRKEINQKLFFDCRQNCFTEAAKQFRQVYRKPDYLPASVELDVSNWVFVCSQYTGRKTVKVQW